MCAYIPTTLPKNNPLAVSLMASQLSTSFVLETFIHAKEKVGFIAVKPPPKKKKKLLLMWGPLEKAAVSLWKISSFFPDIRFSLSTFIDHLCNREIFWKGP